MVIDSHDISDVLDELFDIAEKRAIGVSSDINNPLLEELAECNDRYINREVIAQGGMKIIERVFDVKSNRYVAMATLHKESSESLYDQFIREARLTAMLEHPNIISVYDIGVENGNPFFTMELKVGDSLDEILQRRRKSEKGYVEQYSLKVLLEMFLKICDAVSFAHSKNVIHLDLKPANIQIGKYGEVIVCDWGLGKIIGTNDIDTSDSGLFDPDMLNEITLTGKIKGTPGFMAPEQIIKGGEKSKLSDIYSLGAVLYCILAGVPPLSGDTAFILKNTLDGSIKPPRDRALDYDLPVSLNAVVVKAMSVDPQERYQSVELLRNEIHHFLSGHSTLAENAGIIKELILVFKRNRAVCLSLLGSFLLIAVLTGSFINGLNQSKKDAERARDEAEHARDEAEIARATAEMNRRRAEYDQKRYFEMLQELKSERSPQSNRNSSDNSFRVDMFSFIELSAYDNPAKSLNKLLEQLNVEIKENPDSMYLYTERGFVYFIMQDLDKAYDDFSKHCANWFYKQFYKICKKYKNEKFNETLPTDIIVHIINDMYGSANLFKVAILMVKYDAVVRRSLSDHACVVKALLKNLNPEWDEKEFEFDEDSRTLVVKGKGLFRLGLYQLNEVVEKRVSAISTLKIKRLVVADTDLLDVDYLSGENLEYFDMRRSLVRNIYHIFSFPNMKTLIISPNQIFEAQLKAARKHFNVIIK